MSGRDVKGWWSRMVGREVKVMVVAHGGWRSEGGDGIILLVKK